MRLSCRLVGRTEDPWPPAGKKFVRNKRPAEEHMHACAMLLIEQWVPEACATIDHLGGPCRGVSSQGLRGLPTRFMHMISSARASFYA